MPFQKKHKLSPKSRFKPTDLARFKALSKVFPASKLAQIFGISQAHAQMMKLGYRVTKSVPVLKARKPHKNRKLTDKQVRTLRQEYKAGVSQFKLAKKYGVSQPVIWDIVNNRSYKV